MRTVIPAIVAGTLLCGCLEKQQADFDGDVASAQPGNSAPTISGTAPASVKFGNNYWFRPSASDPDGDKLTFEIQNLPRWATFE
ncbi:MAG: hypothetical protein MJA32_00340, partial [Proteobacteria bacterium]|nr:hypothetical protein [Pseudomonadota bacterium]